MVLTYILISKNLKLDLRGVSELMELDVSDNQLTELDLSGTPQLIYLGCCFNELTELDLRVVPQLIGLNCTANQLTALDLSSNPSLERFEGNKNLRVVADGTPLSALPGFDVSKASRVNGGSFNNGCVAFDAGKNIINYAYDCGRNKTATFYLRRDETAGPIGLPVDQTTFPDANFLAVVREMPAAEDGILTAAELAMNRQIDCTGREISSLKGIEHFTGLTSLLCQNNQLTELDLRQNHRLVQVVCDNNQLTTLKLSSGDMLTGLYCSSNRLTELSPSEFPNLQYLYCSNNPLTALDLTANPQLERLDCSNTGLTALDLSRNPLLLEAALNGNQLTELNLAGNPKLERLECDDNRLLALDVSRNPAMEVLSCNHNQLTSLDTEDNPVLYEIYCEGNRRVVADGTRTTELPGFNRRRAKDFQGGSIRMGKVRYTGSEMTYNYEICENTWMTFTLVRDGGGAPDPSDPTVPEAVRGPIKVNFVRDGRIVKKATVKDNKQTTPPRVTKAEPAGSVWVPEGYPGVVLGRKDKVTYDFLLRILDGTTAENREVTLILTYPS